MTRVRRIGSVNDLRRVTFTPRELLEASRRLLESAPAAPSGQAQHRAVEPDPRVLASGPVADAVHRIVGAFIAAGNRAIADRERALRAYIRVENPDVGSRFVEQAIWTLRRDDQQRVREASERLTRDLAESFAEPSRPVREARVRAVLDRERFDLDRADESAEERALEIAEAAWAWAGCPKSP